MKVPKIHELKVSLKFYPFIENKTKTFEIRKNDRKFKKYDFLDLRPFDSEKNEYIETGRRIAKITFVLTDCKEYGLMDGYAILGLKFFEELSYEEKLLFRLVENDGIKPDSFS